MKKIITALLSMAIVLGVAQVNLGAADKKPEKGKSDKKKAAPKKKRDTYPYRGIIGEIDGNKIIIKQKSGNRTIVVSEGAKVTIDGKKGKLGDIKAGDYVTGQVKKTDGKESAISVYKKDKPAAKPKGKKPTTKKKKTDDK